MSCNKKPWSDYAFGSELAYLATMYLNNFDSESDELLCSLWQCQLAFLRFTFKLWGMCVVIGAQVSTGHRPHEERIEPAIKRNFPESP